MPQKAQEAQEWIRDSRAAYGIYDTEKDTLTLRHVAYDIEKAIQRIVDAGIPEENGRRLREGG